MKDSDGEQSFFLAANLDYDDQSVTLTVTPAGVG